MIFNSRKEKMFILLGGFFITNAILAEMIGGKLLSVGPFLISMGILPWPIVFLSTDLINEYFGRTGVKRLTWLTTGLIAYLFLMLYIGQHLKASPVSPISDTAFNSVFGQTSWLIFASIIAFVVSQMVDVSIFWLLREKTGKKMIWLRSTGSTIISQLIDSFVIGGIGFYLPGKLTFDQYVNASGTAYAFKVIVAVGLTPMIYAGHALIDRYLGDEAEQAIASAARSSTN
ncbi:MAG: queuosine precursor transporter [Bacteroidota bacterium]